MSLKKNISQLALCVYRPINLDNLYEWPSPFKFVLYVSALMSQ